MKIRIVVLLMQFCFCYLARAQNVDLKLSEIINGTWGVESRGPVVDINNPESGSKFDYQKEIIKASGELITFADSKFAILKGESGTFTIKGTSLYLNGNKYKYGIYDKNKISLIRIISPDLM